MRRLFAIVFLVGCLPLLFGGCVGEEGGLLAYAPRLLSADVQEGECLWRIVPEGNGFSGTVLSPACAAGITLHLTDGEASALLGDVRIPLGGRMYTSAARMLSCFARTAEDIADVRADPHTGGVEITFTDGMQLSLDKEGNPLVFVQDGVRYTVRALQLQPNT